MATWRLPLPDDAAISGGLTVGAPVILEARTSDGSLRVPGLAGADCNIIQGSRTAKQRLLAAGTTDAGQWSYNASGGVRDDATTVGWVTSMYSSINQWRIDHIDAAGASRLDFYIDGLDGKCYPTALGNATVPVAAIKPSQGGVAATIPTAFSITGSPNAYNVWIKVTDFPVLTTRGSRVQLSGGLGLNYNSLSATPCAVGLLFRRSGTDVPGSGAWFICGVAGVQALPNHIAWDAPAAGTYTYSLWCYLASTTSGSINVHGNGAPWIWATELAA